jgi:predicted Rossmann fold nucleotide-binding protein DprA/Smf involved in DNA uptake
MKKVQTQLKTIAKTLAGLAEKIEKLNAAIGTAPAKKKAAPVKKKAAPAKKKAAPAKKKAAVSKKAPAKKAPTAASKETVLDSVLSVIGKSKDGADIASLKSQTGLESRQLSNALYKLTKKGSIKSKSRGVYVKA